MNITLSGAKLCGEVQIIGSKSDIHRLLICAAFADKETEISGVTMSKDIAATVRCLRAFAADISINGDTLAVSPYKEIKKNALLDCGESGSTLRFLLPVVAALGADASFTGQGRLAERPLSPLYELLEENGVSLSKQGAFPLLMQGKFNKKEIEIDGSVSSQFISGLLFAAPLLGGATIRVTGKVESAPYILMTCNALRRFGVTVVEKTPYCFQVSGGYKSPSRLRAEGDWSNAAFWLVAAALSDSRGFTVENLNHESLQGDMEIVKLLERAGVVFERSKTGLRLVVSEEIKPLLIDAAQIPDLVPIVALLACKAKGDTRISGAARLIYKESNRLQSVSDMINALGGAVEIMPDGLVIHGKGGLKGGTVNAQNDHRIAMTAAVASLICDVAVTIEGAEAVEKSYPAFYEEFTAKGATICPQASEQN